MPIPARFFLTHKKKKSDLKRNNKKSIKCTDSVFVSFLNTYLTRHEKAPTFISRSC